MKKIVCLVLALLCVSVMAVAESTPSKTTADLTLIQTSAANLPEGASFTLAPVTTARAADLPDYEERVAACEAEIAKLAQSASVAEYFGTVTDSEGNEINLTEILGADALNVYEFLPLVVDGYDPAYGNVTATMEFSTPYEEGEQVVVLVGLVTVWKMALRPWRGRRCRAWARAMAASKWNSPRKSWCRFRKAPR